MGHEPPCRGQNPSLTSPSPDWYGPELVLCFEPVMNESRSELQLFQSLVKSVVQCTVVYVHCTVPIILSQKSSSYIFQATVQIVTHCVSELAPRLNWPLVQKPNSWTYNHVEVSEHNLGSYQTLGFCMDFFKHREGVWFSIRFSSVLLTETVRGCVSLNRNLKQICRDNKEENSYAFCLDFVQEFGLWTVNSGHLRAIN